MSVHITALGDLGKWSWKTFARVTSDIATGGAAELAWNKKSRKAIAKGAKKIGKVAGKVAEKTLCPVADKFTSKDTAKAAVTAGGGYGAAAVAAANVVSNLCPKNKKKPTTPAEIVAEQKRSGPSAAVVGGVGVALGLLLGALFAGSQRGE